MATLFVAGFQRPWLRRIAFLHSLRCPHMRSELHLSRVGQARKKLPAPVSIVLCDLTGSWSAYRSEWSGHRLLTGWVLYSTGLVRFFTRRTLYRSLSSLVHSLAESLTHAHCHSRAHTYATRNTMPRYCDVHVFPHLLKVRLLNMLHSIRPDYVII